MTDFPKANFTGGWNFPRGGVSNSTGGQRMQLDITSTASGSSRQHNGYSYVGASSLSQPRRHFQNSTPVLGNYVSNASETEMNPFVSNFATTSQQQMSGRSAHAINTPAEDNYRQFYDFGMSNYQLSHDLPDPQMQVQLCDKNLWDQFSRAGTEMIVTKTGRRMFPGYRIKLSGLDKDTHYCIMMDIVNVDDHRYKFQHGEWTIAGRGEPHLPQRFFLHPDSPATGAKWMSEVVSFHKVKLTNSIGRDVDGKIVLNSMHRYQPRIHIVKSNDTSTVHLKQLCTFAFPQTVFITVTAYQNPEVTQLKIDNNPFAKGFREDGARAKKPKSLQNQASDFTRFAYMDHKRHAGGFGYNPMPMPRTPVVTAPFCRSGYDDGAVHPFSSRTGSYLSNQNQPRPHMACNQLSLNLASNFSEADSFGYWGGSSSNSTTFGIQSNSHADQAMMGAHTSLLSENSSHSSLNEDSCGKFEFPASETNSSPILQSRVNNDESVVGIQRHEPQNIEDLMNDVGGSATTYPSSHICREPATVSSTDSGVGLSPAKVLEKEHPVIPITPNTRMDGNVRGFYLHRTANSVLPNVALSASGQTGHNQIVNQDLQNRKTCHEKTRHFDPDKRNDKASGSVACASGMHMTTSQDADSNPVELSNESSSATPRIPPNMYQNASVSFSFGPESVHSTYGSDNNDCDEDSINWETKHRQDVDFL